jgi:uncharacterized protein
MGKVLFWVVVVFAVLFALRLYNAAKAKRRADAAREAERKPTDVEGDPMVRCARCGIYLPRAEAAAQGTGYVCREPTCARRG